MRIPDSRLQDLLISSDKADKAKMESLAEQAKAEKKPLQEIVIKNKVISEKDLTRLYAESIEMPFIELSDVNIDENVLTLIPERIARKYLAVIFEVDGKTHKLAMADPDDLQAIDFLEKQLGKNLEIYVATPDDILQAINQLKEDLGEEITKVITPEDEAEEEVSEEELAEDSPVAKTVNIIIEYAIQQGASDIHIEPRENYVQVRYRIDGVLREANRLPRKVLAAMVSRIKILANLKIDEHRAPQDGRFKIQKAGQLVALRVSTLPVMDGEKVVMRLLNESARPLTLKELGFSGVALKSMKRAMSEPHGIILVTGPTGSGKSTTLFSVLSALNTPSVNISTIEDPVEYRIQGANQTQTNPKAGMTFASGLRALLRQDPNIIMVGEIRDKETSGLAIQAALTGHLVFSTLHTNNAATTLPRLLDMGAEPFLIASTTRAVVGQRLVRKLCSECKVEYRPKGKELEHIKSSFHVEQVIGEMQETAKATEEPEEDVEEGGKRRSKVLQPLGDTQSKSIVDKLKEDPAMVDRTSDQAEELTKAEQKVKAAAEAKKQEKAEVKQPEVPKSADDIVLFKPGQDGCDTCGGSGYKGRIGLYEVLYNDEKISKLIVEEATADDIQNMAIKNGMLTMTQDGFKKALQGKTTIEEIMRVTHE